MTSRFFFKYKVVFWLFFLGTQERNFRAQAFNRLCQPCTTICKEVWWNNQKSNLCSNCLKVLCFNHPSTLAEFFRENVCISAPRNGSLTLISNESLSRLVLNYVKKARTCQPDSSYYTEEILVYEKIIEALINQTRQNFTLDLSRFVEETPDFRFQRPQVRSGSSSQHICSSESEFVSPTKVEHEGTGMIVDLLRLPSKKQIFHVRKCRSHRPIITISSSAHCKTEKTVHQAYIKMRLSQYVIRPKSFRKCRKAGEFVICDDWIRLPTFCTLFIS